MFNVWQAHRAGFGTIPELWTLAKSKDGFRILQDFFSCNKAQYNRDQRNQK